MKLIGLEFRVGMEQFKDIEVITVPLDIVFPFPVRYPHGPTANATLHTSRGDANATFEIGRAAGGGLNIDVFHGSINFDEIQKHYETLRAQIERLHV